MATTSVGTDRLPYDALEKYPDAAFVTDDNSFYFGTGGDISLTYNSGSDVLFVGGGEVAFRDNRLLYFGNNLDTSLEYDEDGNDVLNLAGDSTIVHDINTAAGFVLITAATLEVPLTHPLVIKKPSDVAQTMCMSDGVEGQILSFIMSDAGAPLITLTPGTATGFTSALLSDAFDSVTFRFVKSAGWVLTGAHLPALGSIA